MPSADDYQQQIAREIPDPNGTVAAVLSTVWDLCSDRAARDPTLYLQYLYTKRAALDMRLAEEQPNTTFAIDGDLRDDQSDRFAHLQQMRSDVQAEIERTESVLASDGTALSGCLATRTLSRPAFAGQPSAAAPAYRGSPYVRPPRPR